MVRSFSSSNGTPSRPDRRCRNSTGEPIERRTATAAPARIGAATTRPAAAPATSVARLTARYRRLATAGSDQRLPGNAGRRPARGAFVRATAA